jgi:hypothetical protein
MTDRYHDAASPAVAEQLTLAASSGLGLVSQLTALNYKQVVNYNQQQTDVLFDVTRKLTLRGGYRYVWGDATVRAGGLSQTGSTVSGEMRRHVGLAGVTFRPIQKLSLNLDYEAASGDRVYFRNSLNEYHRARARARFQATASLAVQASFNALTNRNPAADIRYDFESRDNSLAVFWTPAGGKRITVMAEYNRSTMISNMAYLLPPFFSSARSEYRDRAHSATSTIDIALPGYRGLTPKVSAGGSLFVSSGSRASRYYQPLARLSIPFQKNVYWNTEWQYYGYGEQFYFYEGFRTHLFQTGVRLTR